MKFAAKILSITSYAILVTACSSSGSESTAPISPEPAVVFPAPGLSPRAEPGEGIWQGKITSDVGGDSRDIVGLVDGWGWMTLITDKGQLFGAIHRQDVSDDRAEFSVDLTGITAAGFSWLDGSSVAQVTFVGTISPPTEINGNYSGAGDSGTISLSFDPASDRPLSLARIEGMWANRNSPQNITAIFDISSGAINGSDENGCIYSGKATADGWMSVYIYDTSVTVSNCPAIFGTDFNGEYVGPAGLTDIEAGSHLDDMLIIGISNDEHAITLTLERI